MIKALIPTEMSKGQHDNTKTSPKSSITQRLRTGLGRSDGTHPTSLQYFALEFQCRNTPSRPILLHYLAVGGGGGLHPIIYVPSQISMKYR